MAWAEQRSLTAEVSWPPQRGESLGRPGFPTSGVGLSVWEVFSELFKSQCAFRVFRSL